jgi:hypothetical protein
MKPTLNDNDIRFGFTWDCASGGIDPGHLAQLSSQARQVALNVRDDTDWRGCLEKVAFPN